MLPFGFQDPSKRPSARELLEHTFLKKHSSAINYQSKLRDHSQVYSRARDIPQELKAKVKDTVAQIQVRFNTTPHESISNDDTIPAQFSRFYSAKGKGKRLRPVKMR